jgi:hypothetical protein
VNSIPELFIIKEIPKRESYEWLLKKHYAHIIPQLCYTFGLLNNINNELVGVCTFGVPPNRHFNNGECIFGKEHPIKTLELNRLVVNEGLPKNTLSYFVSKSLKLLPTPLCIVSYSDANVGHHGYIYQATNWIYTGLAANTTKYVDKNNLEKHKRTLSHQHGSISLNNLSNLKIIKQQGKYRYLKFLGNKKEIKEMNKYLKWKILPYPKGNNVNYDASYEIKNLNLNKKGKEIE